MKWKNANYCLKSRDVHEFSKQKSYRCPKVKFLDMHDIIVIVIITNTCRLAEFSINHLWFKTSKKKKKKKKISNKTKRAEYSSFEILFLIRDIN